MSDPHCTCTMWLSVCTNEQLKGVFLIGTSVKKAVPTVRIVQITPHIPRLAKRFTQKTLNQDSG